MITEPEQAEHIVATGEADCTAHARAFLLDPATTRMAGSLVIDAALRSVEGVRSLRYLARQHPGPVNAPLRLGLRAGLGARMLVSYASGRVAAGARFTRRAEGVGRGRG